MKDDIGTLILAALFFWIIVMQIKLYIATRANLRCWEELTDSLKDIENAQKELRREIEGAA